MQLEQRNWRSHSAAPPVFLRRLLEPECSRAIAAQEIYGTLKRIGFRFRLRRIVGSELVEGRMGKRILIVEDRDDSRTILVALLTRLCGYETIEAANGAEAVEKAASEKPDLILMDLDLPDISGIDAAKAVKENPDTAHIPIIAQTAWSSRQWRGKVLKVGMVDYLEKPVSLDLMKATIEKFILP